MKKKYRLLKNEQFRKIITRKRPMANRALIFYYQKNHIGHLRIGISVGKKCGNAVVRNKIKRQLRMMCQVFIKEHNHSYDLIIIVKKDYIKHSYNQNRIFLNKMFSKFLNKENAH